jgi:hypothetical protein
MMRALPLVFETIAIGLTGLLLMVGVTARTFPTCKWFRPRSARRHTVGSRLEKMASPSARWRSHRRVIGAER